MISMSDFVKETLDYKRSIEREGSVVAKAAIYMEGCDSNYKYWA